MKHVIEPTFIVDYTTEIANQASVPITNDASDYVVGGATRVTYGLTNRLFYRSRPLEGERSQTREFLTIGVQPDLLHQPPVEPVRHHLRQLLRGGRRRWSCRRSP